MWQTNNRKSLNLEITRTGSWCVRGKDRGEICIKISQKQTGTHPFNMKGYLAAKLHISLLLFEPLHHASRLCVYIYSSLYPPSVRIPAESSSSPSLFALRWSWLQVWFCSCLLLSVSTLVSHLVITLGFKRPA